MNRGGKILCGVAVLAVAACAGNPGKLEIRPTKTVLASGERPVPVRIAEGYGQLSLGNVGLALESFRKGLRDDPSSTDAMVGIASSYDRMGRFDLARRYYEQALAITPGDTQILAALAGSLDLQGQGAEAALVRSEIAARLAAAAAAAEPAPPTQLAEAAPAGDKQRSASATAVPAAQQKIASVAPAPDVQAIATDRSLATPSPRPVAVEPLSTKSVETGEASAALPRPMAPVALAEAAAVEPGPSVTIKLPPPRPAPAPVAEARAEEITIAPAVTRRDQEGPRLERLSMGVVALVTVSGPVWRSEPVSRTARSTTVRFVPHRTKSDVAEVRLLNAARVHRLAARTRAWLAGRGWRDVSIGDAPSTRSRSVIFYPAGQRSVAQKLAAQFGFAMAQRRDLDHVTVLLGRDSVRIAGAQAKA